MGRANDLGYKRSSSSLVRVSHTPIPPSDHGTVTAGDRQNLGIYKHGRLIFMSNGDKGVAVFDVRSPTKPKYIGTYGNMDATDNIMSVAAFHIGAQMYVAYGDGVHVAPGSPLPRKCTSTR